MLFGVAGLTLAADRPVPGLAPSDAPDPDVLLHTAEVPPWHQPALVSLGHVIADTTHARLTRLDAGFSLKYSDDTEFWIDALGDQLWMVWTTTFEDACTYLTGPVIALLLRVRGDLALHASAVRVRDVAYAFVGPHGAGKSTTAAALGRRGCPIVTDDVLRLTHDGSAWLAHPFGTVLRLWPEAEALVLGNASPLPRITPSWDKRALPLGMYGVRAAREPLPLRAIVLLESTDAADAAGDGPVAAPVQPAEALVHLAANSAAAHFIDGVQRAAEFEQLSRLVADVPCLRSRRAADEPADHFFDRLWQWINAPAHPLHG